MKSCEYNQLLSLYIDNQLDAEQMNSLEGHLHLCPRCKSEIAELIELKRHCMELPEEDTPAGFHEKLMSRIKDDKPKKNGRLMRHILAPIAAAVLMFILGQSILNSDLTGLESTPRDSGNLIMAEIESDQVTGFGKSAEIAEDAGMKMAEALPETADFVENDQVEKNTKSTIYIILGVTVVAAGIVLTRWRKTKKESTR